jgi:hypothetical protein
VTDSIDALDPDMVAPDLEAALVAGDTAKVALALRNGPVIVPLLDDRTPRTFHTADDLRRLLLLFSSADAYVAATPNETGHQLERWERERLAGLLRTNEGVFDAVVFDIASDHPMQADPGDLLRALEL